MGRAREQDGSCDTQAIRTTSIDREVCQICKTSKRASKLSIMGALYWALYATRTPHADFSQLHTTILIACKPNSKIRSRVQPNTPSPQPYHARDRRPPLHALPPPLPMHRNLNNRKSTSRPPVAIAIACKAHTTTLPRAQPNAPILGHRARPQPRPVCPPTPGPCPTTPRFTCFCQKHLVTLPALPGRYDGTTLVSCVFRPILPWYPCAGATGNGRLAPLHEVHGPLFHREPLTICTF